MPFPCAPVQSSKSAPMLRGSRRWTEQSSKGLQYFRVGLHALSYGVCAAEAKSCAQHLHFVIRGLREKVVGVPHGRNGRVVPLVPVHGRIPKNIVPPQSVPDPCAPATLGVVGSVGGRRESGRRQRCFRRALL